MAIRLVCAAGFDPEVILLAIWKTSQEQEPILPNYLVAPRRRVGQLLREALQCKSRPDMAQMSSETSSTAARSKSCRDPFDVAPFFFLGTFAFSESHTTVTLRKINTAQVTFAETHQRGFVASLNQLGPAAAGQPSAVSAGLVEPLLAGLCPGGTANTFYARGYRFEYTPGPAGFGWISTYTLTARPIVYQGTGTRSFFVDQSSIIRATAQNRPASAQDPPI